MPDNPFADNPYAYSGAIPTPVATTKAQPLNSLNLFRDGKQIVVVGNQFVFPPCCVMTGSDQNLVPKAHTVKFVPHSIAWTLMFGVIGAAIAQATMGRQLQLNLPISNDWLAKKKKHSRRGLFIALGGGAVFLLSLVAMLSLDPRQQELSNLIGIPALLGMLTGLGGLIYMAAAGSVNLVGCSKMEGNCVWLTGAAADFLALLPEWSTQGPPGAPGVMRR
ncbi:hypothetical protein [Anatilimnocola floriformis]|uniref:hypothetical protein n=1 Tax=Anatilimnocola floriformis TaxID=2948575 RepID=UPI0020C520CF|nr:hypothetical protein [Anatilimnocola floriformis]